MLSCTCTPTRISSILNRSQPIETSSTVQTQHTCHTHCQHVVTLHVWQFSVFALVVELPEEVEGPLLCKGTRPLLTGQLLTPARRQGAEAKWPWYTTESNYNNDLKGSIILLVRLSLTAIYYILWMYITLLPIKYFCAIPFLHYSPPIHCVPSDLILCCTAYHDLST